MAGIRLSEQTLSVEARCSGQADDWSVGIGRGHQLRT